LGDTGSGSVSPVDPKDLGRHAGLNLKYANGPLAIGYGYGEQKSPFGTPLGAAPAVDANGNVTTGTTNALAGSYDFQVVKINAGYQMFKTKDSTINADDRVWNIGADMPVFGADHVKLVYAKYQDKADNANNSDADLVSLGYVHPMSKRTTLYATYAKLTNESNAKVSLFGGAQATNAAGYDPSGFQVGLSHDF